MSGGERGKRNKKTVSPLKFAKTTKHSMMFVKEDTACLYQKIQKENNGYE